jgi:hypothetical protein
VLLLALSLLANVVFAAWIASAAVREQAAFRRGQADQVARLHREADALRLRARLQDATILRALGGQTGRRLQDRARLLADANALDGAARLLTIREEPQPAD